MLKDVERRIIEGPEGSGVALEETTITLDPEVVEDGVKKDPKKSSSS